MFRLRRSSVSLVFGIGHHVDILEDHEERMYAVHSVVLGCDACGHLLLANLEPAFLPWRRGRVSGPHPRYVSGSLPGGKEGRPR